MDISIMMDKNFWLVGSSFGAEGGDQTNRFLSEGIWENGYEDKYLDDVRSVQVGEKIAIKSAYTRKKRLPFEANDKIVSVMGIKAIGTVTKNHGDGQFLDVSWDQKFESVKEWYFFTNRTTIWRVQPEDWMRSALIGFVFNDEVQDYSKFRNAPYWSERYGDKPEEDKRFQWSSFYGEVATALLDYKNNRGALVRAIYEIIESNGNLNKPTDIYKDGTKGPLKDICPFTLMGTFNRTLKDGNRIDIAKKLATFLKVDSDVPKSFEGIPVLNNQRSWFFAYENKRDDKDIDQLWAFFELAINYADDDQVDDEQFVRAYDQIQNVKFASWNITMGLYWIRPWSFATLDTNSRNYIDKKLNLDISAKSLHVPCTGREYLNLVDTLKSNFVKDNYPCHSFPDLSLKSWASEPIDSSVKWKELMIESIQRLCIDKDTNVFSRKEFLSEFLNKFEICFPENTNVSHTISKQFQLLRDEDVLEFIEGEKGSYRYLLQYLDTIEEPISNYEIKVFHERYGISDIRNDGCFIDEGKLSSYISILKKKKNLILQGPPGTGKTWLAKRLGYSAIGHLNDQALKAVQFHPNISYEDFVRGWRPSGEGRLELVDGPFLELVHKANNDKSFRWPL